MSSYNMKEFASLVGKSTRQIYRYIKRGQAPDGNRWEPAMIDGAYTFTDLDINRFPEVDDIFRKTTADYDNVKTSSEQQPQDVIISVIESIEDRNSKLFNQFEAIHDKYQTALEAQVSSAQNDYDTMKDKYVMTQVKLKQSELEIQALKSEIVELKGKLEASEQRNRSIFARLFHPRT